VWCRRLCDHSSLQGRKSTGGTICDLHSCYNCQTPGGMRSSSQLAGDPG
jgi:hypothetical protein